MKYVPQAIGAPRSYGKSNHPISIVGGYIQALDFWDTLKAAQAHDARGGADLEPQEARVAAAQDGRLKQLEEAPRPPSSGVLSVHLSVDLSIYRSIYVYVDVDVYVHKYLSVCMYVCMHACICICMCMYRYIFICICKCICTCIHMYI